MTASTLRARVGKVRTCMSYMDADNAELVALQCAKRDGEWPLLLTLAGVHEDSSDEEIRSVLGVPGRVRGRNDSDLLSWLRFGQLSKRASEWRWRLGEELERVNASGWFCFMVTLTVDPKVHDAREVIESGDAWSAYRLRWCEVVRNACGYAQPQRGGPKRSDYLRYFSVVEHGKRDHHHIHAVIMARDIPVEWKRDPNEGLRRCTRREVLPAKSLWDYGSVTVVSALRFVGDAWSVRLGWRLPAKLTRLVSARDAGSYVVKYLSKEGKQWKHRVRATSGLGLSRLRLLMTKLSRNQLNATMCRVPENLWSLRRTSVPGSLLRSEASLEMWRRKLLEPPIRRSSLIFTSLMMVNTSAWHSMLASVRDGRNPSEMDFSQLLVWLDSVIPAPVQVGVSDYKDAIGVWNHWYPKVDRSPGGVGLPGVRYR